MNQPSAAEHRQPHDRMLDAVRNAASAVADGATLTSTELRTVGEALADPEVRMVCLGFAAGCDDAVDPAAAAALWRRLITDVAVEHLEGPAVLLAYAAALAEDHATVEQALNIVTRTAPQPAEREDLAVILRDLHDRGPIRPAGLAAGCHDFALNGRFYLDQR